MKKKTIALLAVCVLAIAVLAVAITVLTPDGRPDTDDGDAVDKLMLSEMSADDIICVLEELGVSIPAEYHGEGDISKTIKLIEDDPDRPIVVSYIVASDFYEEVRAAVKQYYGWDA